MSKKDAVNCLGKFIKSSEQRFYSKNKVSPEALEKFVTQFIAYVKSLKLNLSEIQVAYRAEFLNLIDVLNMFYSEESYDKWKYKLFQNYGLSPVWNITLYNLYYYKDKGKSLFELYLNNNPTLVTQYVRYLARIPDENQIGYILNNKKIYIDDQTRSKI
jgi:hypothetical protein